MGTSKGSKGKKLALNKETLKDLSPSSTAGVQGGLLKGLTGAACSDPCPATKLLCPHKTTVPAGCPSTVTGGGILR
jgi:hypothetical protein